MLIQQRSILPREFFIRFQQAVLQLDIVDFVGLRFDDISAIKRLARPAVAPYL